MCRLVRSTNSVPPKSRLPWCYSGSCLWKQDWKECSVPTLPELHAYQGELGNMQCRRIKSRCAHLRLHPHVRKPYSRSRDSVQIGHTHFRVTDCVYPSRRCVMAHYDERGLSCFVVVSFSKFTGSYRMNAVPIYVNSRCHFVPTVHQSRIGQTAPHWGGCGARYPTFL